MNRKLIFPDIDGTLTPAGDSDTVALLLTNSDGLEGVGCGSQ